MYVKKSTHLVHISLLIFLTSLFALLFISQLSIVKNEYSSFIGIDSCNLSKTCETFQQNTRQKSLPQAIIIGSRKCGTRALLKFLDIHPKISAARKEVHYFDNDDNFSKGLKWYQHQMPDSEDQDNPFVIEKSPAYFVTPKAIERIKNMSSTIKLILIVRNPVIRLISDFSQLSAQKISRRLGNLPPRVYNNVTVMNQIANRYWKEESEAFKLLVLNSKGGINESRKIIQTGIYASHLEKWLKVFSWNQILIVDGENLVKNPFPELEKVETFLQLEHLLSPSDFVFVENKGFFCINKTEVANGTRDYNKYQLICLSDSKGRRHIDVTSKLKTKLAAFYKPHNEHFYALVGVKYTWETIT